MKLNCLDGDNPSINASPVTDAGEGIILLKTTTNMDLNVGFTIGGSLVGVQEVHGGETSKYYVHPTYYVAVYSNIKKGSMVDSGAIMGPVQLKFDDRHTNFVVEAAIDGGKGFLKEPVPVPT